MPRKRKKTDNGGMRGDEWLNTYSDCITLLLTFFILLYSMSTVDEAKLRQLSKAFNEIMVGKVGDSVLKYNLYNGEVPVIGGEEEGELEGDVIVPSSHSMYDEIKRFSVANNLDEVVEITEDERGIILQLKDSILFESGKSNLKSDSKEILNKLSNLIKEMPNSIVIEGHTDNVPINTSEYKNNWELSTARSLSVVEYFISDKGLNPSRFSASGYGEYKPLVSNTTIENKSKNRRVNILIVAEGKER